MTGKIIPFGYANGGPAQLERLMREKSAYLVDIRLIARSEWQAFDQQALQAKFPNRYMHMPELGNVNYNRQDRGIEIANPDQGISRLINGIHQGYTIVLMCGCKQYELCHRHTVVHLLLQAMPEALVEMPESPADTLKCLSIRQPWAWLITHPEMLAACGLSIKDLENRNWNIAHRGPVLIHASSGVDDDLFRKGQLDYGYWAYKFGNDGTNLYARMPQRKEDYPRGAIVGLAHLVDVVQQSSSIWFVGRYGFVLMDAKAFKTPIPFRGSLKLFDVEREVVAHAEVSDENDNA